MSGFLFKRLILIVPLVLAVTLLTFFLIHLAPGNYFDVLKLNPLIQPETIAQYEAKYHFNEPFLVQYGYWLKNLIKGDFGYSFYFQQPVGTLLASRLWNTFLLSFVSFLVAWLLAIPLGVLAAAWKDSLFDRLLSFLAYVFLSVPGFFLALLLLFWASQTNALPIGGIHSVHYDQMNFFAKMWDVFHHMVIPVTVLATGSGAYLFRLMRSSMIESLQQDYIAVLKVRGVSRFKRYFKHALRNAINPLVTLFGLELPSLFSGAALLEIITAWPGLGLIMLQAVRSQDIFLVLGNLVMVSFLLMIGNLISDLLLFATDPRIRNS